MNQMSEQELRDAVIATKKDAKLVAAAKNDRNNSGEFLHKEFSKLPVERQKEIIGSISNDHFIGAQWKVAFPLNSLPAANAADGVQAAGKALFLSREEDGVKETIRALRLYQESPFFKVIATGLGDAAEMVRIHLAGVARILTDHELYGMIQTLDATAEASTTIIKTVIRIATYTRNYESTMAIAKFLYARRHSASLNALAKLIEDSVFMARDARSVREILAGLGAGAVDRVLQRHSDNPSVLSKIRDLSWKTRNSRAIRNYLDEL